MWHSPRQTSDAGKRYTPAELAALLEPLELLLDALGTNAPQEVVTEPILQRMETDELVFAVHEVFSALLEDMPAPRGGHPGFQEAVIAELLDQCCGLVELELSEPSGDGAGSARRSAWQSFSAFCSELDSAGRRLHPLVEHLELIHDDPQVHLCPVLTAEIWQEMLLGDGGSVAAEFLWDYDWRNDSFLDRRSAGDAWVVAEEADINLALVHQLPKSPKPEELAAARKHLRGLVEIHAAAGR